MRRHHSATACAAGPPAAASNAPPIRRPCCSAALALLLLLLPLAAAQPVPVLDNSAGLEAPPGAGRLVSSTCAQLPASLACLPVGEQTFVGPLLLAGIHPPPAVLPCPPRAADRLVHVFTPVPSSFVTRARVYTTGSSSAKGVGELLPASMIGTQPLNTQTIVAAGGCQVTFNVVDGGWAELRFANGASFGCFIASSGGHVAGLLPCTGWSGVPPGGPIASTPLQPPRPSNPLHCAGPWALALRSSSGPGNAFNVHDVASGGPPGGQNGWTYLASEFKRVTGSTASPTIEPLPSAASSLRLLAM